MYQSNLEKHLDINNILPSTLNIPQNFTISMETLKIPPFDPTLEFEQIGRRKFDHVSYFDTCIFIVYKILLELSGVYFELMNVSKY
jgi:hypothetical protein